VFVAFALFVVADGATHLAAVWTVWQPSVWLGHRPQGGDGDATDEALRHADERAPDVVVNDLAMPARDGYALRRALHGRGLARGLVTIALTAHARREDRERALGAGYDAYVTKPVEPAALAALVRELVEKRRRPS